MSSFWISKIILVVYRWRVGPPDTKMVENGP